MSYPPPARPAAGNWIRLLASSLTFLCSQTLSAQVPALDDGPQLSYFEKHIRPALIEYCYECHAAETEASGGLLLDSRQGWQVGGDSGSAIVPGQPAESRLLIALSYDDPDLQMPPEKKLPPDVLQAFEKWIADGAHDPRGDASLPVESPPAAALSAESRSDYWSYQPLKSDPLRGLEIPPGVAPIDAFINRQLAEAGLEVAPPAERLALVRRLSFDLTGLPPSYQDTQRLVAAEDFEAAYRDLVERWLASPQFSEAMARRWMDVARYAESVTLRGLVFKEAWRYRDYLTAAFAQDRPFNQMICEQIAGDLMQADDQHQRWLQLVATGFLAMGDTNFEKQDKTQLDMDYVDEQLDVIGQAFLGQTLGCARCHDHKFDPIPTRDYYAMAGILKSSVAMRHANVSNWIEQPLPLPTAEEDRFKSLESELQSVSQSLADMKKRSSALTKKMEQSGHTADAVQEMQAQVQTLAEEMKVLGQTQSELQQQVELRPKFLTVVEEEPPQDIRIHIRGDVHNQGAVVPRGFLTAVRVEPAISIPPGKSGRLELAQWIASDQNPLTARVYVNRLWLWFMGQGLVESVNNFGTTGTLPSHPELLDWLAGELIRSGWSTKQIVRSIVLSDAYRRQTVAPSQAHHQVDPDNRLYWRGQQRRLTAEEVRDAMLLASGELDLTWGGNLMEAGTKSDGKYQHSSTRRSIYHPAFRNSLPELLDAFDYPPSSISVGQRSRSTVATQPLALLNDPWIHARARALATSISSAHSQVAPQVWIQAAYERCFQRLPTAAEVEICLEFFAPMDPERYPEQLEQLAHTLLASLDFRYLR